MTGRRVAAVAVIVAALGALGTGRAGAHAAIVSSDPEPGESLTAAPGVVVLRFTEPLNADLSRAAVVDPDGRRFESDAPRDREIRVPLSTNTPGTYTVEWTTVSTVDGHTLRGSFRFGVGVAPGAGEGAELDPGPAELLVAVARAVEDASLLLAIGMLLLGALGRRPPGLAWVRPRIAAALGVALAAGIAVVAGEALTAAPAPSFGAAAAYLTAGLPGWARALRIGAEAAAVVAALRGARAIAAAAVGVAVVALSAAGHAAAVRPRWWGVAADAGHLAAAGLWAGGILAMATLRPPGGWRGDDGRRFLRRFTPVAIPGFVATVGFGVVRGAQELSGVGDLLSSAYGRVLALKVLGVAMMIPLSLLAWRRFAPRPRAEAALAAGVIAAAALLAAFPLPPRRAVEAEAAAAPADDPALPRAGDLTVGGEAGEVLVGLTVRPARPGPNELLVYLLPLEGEQAAGDVRARISVGGRPAEAERCAPTCRRASADLRGGERVEVTVPGERGGTARFALPSLPPPGGEALLRRVQDRMHRLESYRLEEVLRPADPPLLADYAFRAPDRIRMSLSTGAEMVQVGEVRYRREGPSRPWERMSAPPLEVPRFVWDGRRHVSPQVVETARVDGTRTRVLSLFGPSGQTPIWFRLWVDGEGLVPRAEMRAQGHFMDHRYFGFDEPVEIEPPRPVGDG